MSGGRARAFTLIELVLVLAVLALMAGLVASRLGGRSPEGLADGAAAGVVEELRRARVSAMRSGGSVTARLRAVPAGDRFAFFEPGGSGSGSGSGGAGGIGSGGDPFGEMELVEEDLLVLTLRGPAAEGSAPPVRPEGRAGIGSAGAAAGERGSEETGAGRGSAGLGPVLGERVWPAPRVRVVIERWWEAGDAGEAGVLSVRFGADGRADARVWRLERGDGRDGPDSMRYEVRFDPISGAPTMERSAP